MAPSTPATPAEPRVTLTEAQREEAQRKKEGAERTDAVGKELRDKIRSKIQVTTFLAGFGFAILNGQIGMLSRPEEIWLLQLSVATLAAAVVIFLRSVLLLDGLMMPKMFWRRGATPNQHQLAKYGPQAQIQDFDPPYLAPKDVWTAKRWMQFCWGSMTMVAALLTFISTAMAVVPYAPYDLLNVMPADLTVGEAGRHIVENALRQTLYFAECSVGAAGAYVILMVFVGWGTIGRPRWD